MKKFFTPLIGCLFLFGCAPSEKKASGKEQELQQLKRYILQWKGRETLPPDHHFLFLGIGKGCPGCSYFFIQKAEDAIAEQDSLSVLILLHQRKRPDALQWVKKRENARIDTSMSFLNRDEGLPYPLYLRTDSTGTIKRVQGLKGERKAVLRTLGW